MTTDLASLLYGRRDGGVPRAPVPDADFGSLNPRFAARGDRGAARHAVARFRAFCGDYNDALARWTGGDRDVKFLHGTWWMRVHHGVRVRPLP